MMKIKKIAMVTVALAALSVTSLGVTQISADTQHPHPTYKDTWNYGVTSNSYAYSDYYLEAPTRLGSYSSVTDMFGNIKSSASSNYGWARSGATKSWTWGRANAYYGWYNF